MSRMPAYVYEAPGPHVLLRGNVRDFLKDSKIPAMRSAMRRGWWVRRDRLADVLAALELAGFVVRLRGDLAPLPAPQPRGAKRAVTASQKAGKASKRPSATGQLSLLEVGDAA